MAPTLPALNPPGIRRFTTWTRWLPSGLAAGLVAVGFLASRNPLVHAALVGAALVLVAWNGWAAFRAHRLGRVLSLAIDLRPQHYVQACAQATVLIYWGWSWRPVYDAAPFIAAQVLFAYAYDMVLVWTRRDRYVLGFGPFPVVFSINLFLWFTPDWFGCQLLMVALGFTAKELIRWERDGRRVHVFNPSSFPLAVVSLLLIVTGASDITRGQDIAVSQFYPSHMYVLLFLVGLPGQFLFGVTSMTMSAVLTTYLFGLLYFAATGTYFFLDSYVPIAVFLGMHLLFTDPSTAPRTELGRVIFGVLYGLSAIALYELLVSSGVPAFYDKLLQVPLLNLSVKAIDRIAQSPWLAAVDPARLRPSAVPRRRHLAYMTLWASTFAAMTVAGGVGDRHPGQWLPFWADACAAGRTRACAYLADLETILCGAGSGWACNESALRTREQATRDSLSARATRMDAAATLERGCRLGFVPACRNAVQSSNAEAWERSPPTLADYPVLLRGSKGPIRDRSPAALAARACGQGWPGACGEPTGRVLE